MKKIKFFLMLLVFTSISTINAQRIAQKVGDNPTTINAASVLELESTNKGFLPPRMASGSSISNPPAGMVIYNTTLNCVQVNVGTPAAPDWKCMSVSTPCVSCTATSATLPASPVLGQQIFATNDNCIYTYNGSSWTKICPAATAGSATLTCASSVFAPTSMINGSSYTGTLTVPYTGGNGGSYSAQSVPSTGVTGLTATLVSGSFASGAGNLVYNITGTPTGTGTATFPISIGGSTCNPTNSVVAGAWSATNVASIGGGTSTLVDGNTIKTVLTFTGANQTVTAPAGATGAIIKAWGAGGGGAPFFTTGLESRGGAGAFAGGTIANPSGSFIVMVGEGGKLTSSTVTYGNGGAGGTAPSFIGASGGGLSGVFKTSSPTNLSDAWVIAGGGGGASGGAAGLTFTPTGNGGHGGAAGASTGFDGYDGWSSGRFGSGGNLITGGVAGGNGVNGLIFRGGNGGVGNAAGAGGGGGGGAFGGGGGSGHISSGDLDDAGGGGGSSYTDSTLIGSNKVSGNNGSAAVNSTIAGNSNDVDFVTGIGAGVMRLAGGNGRVVIIWTK